MQHLNEGLDATGLDCISKADILQMIRDAYPVEFQGWIIWSQTAPDVVGAPELEWFLWGELDGNDDKTGTIYYYDNGAWHQLPLVDLSKAADNSMPISKIKRVGTNAYDIIQVNAGNNGLAWISIPNAVQNNTIPTAKLVAPDGINNYILTCLAGVKAFTLIANLAAQFTNNTIPIDKLIKGAANTFLRVKPDASGLEWTTAQIADLLAPGYGVGQSIRRNAGNTGWEPFTPNTATPLTKTVFTNGGVLYAIPAIGDKLEITHGLGVMPSIIRAVLVCVSDTNGYTQLGADEIAIESVDASLPSSNEHAMFGVSADVTKITISRASEYGGGAGITGVHLHKAGDTVAWDATKWKIKVYTLH